MTFQVFERQNQDQPAGFPYGYLRGAYVIQYLFLILWLLMWFVEIVYKLAVRRGESLPPPSAKNGMPAQEGPYKLTWGEKFANASRVIRDGFVLLLASILINQTGYGLDSSATATLWVTFGLFVAWMGVKFVTDNAWLDLIVWLCLTAFLLTNFGLAFR